MNPRARIALWTLALVVIAFGGSWCCAALVRLAYPSPESSGPFSFTAGMRLPVVVVNAALGALPVTVAALIVFALLGFAGWRLACAMRDATVVPISAILIAQAIAGIALTFFAITFSSDPYAYVIFARAHGVFRLNPYIFFGPIGVIGDNVLHQCIAFYGDPPPSDDYGPLWTLIAGVIGRLEATTSLWLQFWTQRVAAVAGAVACTAGVWRLLANTAPAVRRFGASLFAFHPLVLWESAVGGHNDFLMLACAVWAFATVDAYPVLAGVLLGAAIGIKFVPIVVLPVLIARVIRTSGLSSALLCGAVALAVPVATFVPFWSGGATLLPLLDINARLGISPTWLLSIPFFATGLTNLPVAAGLHGTFLAVLTWGSLFRYVLDLALLIVIASVTIAVARGASLRSVWRIVTAFIWTLPSVNSWYVAWLVPAVAFGDAWATYAWWFGALVGLHFMVDSGTASNLPGGIVWVIVITTIFLSVPVLIALRARRRLGDRREQAHAG
jgi:hypothetical protein